MRTLSKSDRWYRYLTIGIYSFPLVTSFAITKGTKIVTPSCPIRHWLGIICPSCGLTRSFRSLADGDFSRSIDYHLFGPIVFIGLGIVSIHCLRELKQRSHLPICFSRYLTRLPVQIGVLISFYSYYLLRLSNIIPTTHL